MKCAFCHEEIGTIKALKGGNMINLHFNDRGQLEKCYIKRKFPFNLIFGKRKYKGIEAKLESAIIGYEEYLKAVSGVNAAMLGEESTCK